MKRAVSLILTLALVLALGPSAAAYSAAYGDEVWLRETQLHDGVTLSENIYWSGGYDQPRRESYITYDPYESGRIFAAAAYGVSVCDRLTAASAAQTYESMGYRVVGSINGDFYDTVTGYPLGVLISEGEILSGSSNYYAVGFREDGSVVMGSPNLTITAADWYGQSLTLAAINKPRVENGGVTLMTYDYNASHTTGATSAGVSVVCTIVDGEAAIGGELTVVVEQVLEQTAEEAAALTLREDQVAFTAAATGTAEGLAFLRGLVPGTQATVSFTANSDWYGVTEAVGAMYLLVENGVAKTDYKVEAAPRTAAGLTADGQLVLYTIDGRQTDYSMGASLNVLAQRMAELGCVTAICFDGGGSTTAMASKPDSETAQVINSPSDGSQRRVSNHLLLLAEIEGDDRPDHIYLSADAPVVLPGHTVSLSANLVDGDYLPIWDEEVELTATAGEIVDGDFVAPQESGLVTITAYWEDMTASVDILVVDTPDEMTVLWDGSETTSVTMVPGDTAEIDVSVLYNHLELETDPSDFTYTIDPALGTISADGVVTTNYTEGSGTVTVSKGNMTVSIQLTLDADSPFVDTDGHWGVTFMASLYHQGILTGVEVDGQLYAYPDNGVTRAEFAVLLARYLGIDTAQYASAGVPFADMDQVDAWAADAVRTMYTLGIVGGVTLNDGTVVFQPQSTLTRADAVTMLGRSLERNGELPEVIDASAAAEIPPVEEDDQVATGADAPMEGYEPDLPDNTPAVVDLSQFADAGEIPDYALPYFRALIYLDVIGGSDGRLDPYGTMTRAAICKVLATMP